MIEQFTLTWKEQKTASVQTS